MRTRAEFRKFRVQKVQIVQKLGAMRHNIGDSRRARRALHFMLVCSVINAEKSGTTEQKGQFSATRCR